MYHVENERNLLPSHKTNGILHYMKKHHGFEGSILAVSTQESTYYCTKHLKLLQNLQSTHIRTSEVLLKSSTEETWLCMILQNHMLALPSITKGEEHPWSKNPTATTIQLHKKFDMQTTVKRQIMLWIPLMSYMYKNNPLKKICFLLYYSENQLHGRFCSEK